MHNQATITKSLIIPVYGNEENIPHLLEALTDLQKTIGDGFEVVFFRRGAFEVNVTIGTNAFGVWSIMNIRWHS